MIWEIPENLELWELVATLALAQNNKYQASFGVHTDSVIPTALLDAAGVIRTSAPGHFALSYMRPDLVDAEAGDLSYPELLAAVAKVPLEMQVVSGPLSIAEIAVGIKPQVRAKLDLNFAWPELSAPGHLEQRGIVICPYTFHRDLELPIPTWEAIIRTLHSYGEPVYLLGEPGQRFTSAKFTENYVLSDLPILEKLEFLAKARLIVGVPNAWTWLATAWKKHLVYFYPERIPVRRWFWAQHDNYGRCVFDPKRVETPVVLAGLRMLINGF